MADISRDATEHEMTLMHWLVNANVLVMQTQSNAGDGMNLCTNALLRVALRAGYAPDDFDELCRKMQKNYRHFTVEYRGALQ